MRKTLAKSSRKSITISEIEERKFHKTCKHSSRSIEQLLRPHVRAAFQQAMPVQHVCKVTDVFELDCLNEQVRVENFEHLCHDAVFAHYHILIRC